MLRISLLLAVAYTLALLAATAASLAWPRLSLGQTAFLLAFALPLLLTAALGLAIAYWRRAKWHAASPFFVLVLGVLLWPFARDCGAWVRTVQFRAHIPLYQEVVASLRNQTPPTRQALVLDSLPFSASACCLFATARLAPNGELSAAFRVSRHLTYEYSPDRELDTGTQIIDHDRHISRQPFAPSWYETWQ